MNVTIYTLNDRLLYFIYLLKGLMSVITIIGVQLITRVVLRAQCKIIINRIPRWGYASNSRSSIEVGLKDRLFVPGDVYLLCNIT